MASYQDQANPGAFVPLTDIFDTQAIYDLDPNSHEFKEFLVRLRQSMNDMAMVLNIKDSGYYVDQEFVNGQVFFPDPTLDSTTAQTPIYRQVFRKVIDFGALPNTALKSVAHGLTITTNYFFTRIYGTSKNPGTGFYIPIPFVDTVLANNIKITVNATNINITTAANYAGYTQTYIVLEFIKS